MLKHFALTCSVDTELLRLLPALLFIFFLTSANVSLVVFWEDIS